MIGASGLSGDTLIACHFPVVQLPTWRLPVQALCGASKRPGRLCPAGLTRAVSLPERDSLTREPAFAGGRRHFSSSYSILNEDRAEDEGGASDSSGGGRYDSTSESPEETGSRPARKDGARGAARSHNSFLPNTDLDEEEEDEDSEGDNLHRYREDSSFVLHGNSNWPLSDDAGDDVISCGGVDGEWGNEGTMLSTDGSRWLSDHPESSPRGSGFTMRACGEPDPSFSNAGAEDVSDSSCNSSDGVLVNFCAIYNKSNNPATPHEDLGSPSRSAEGSVVLNLQPVAQTLTPDLHQEAPSPSPWSPQGLDSNCNLYSLEPLPPGLSSLEVSDLAACLQGQAMLTMGTNQTYYKLVTCDLSSKSPSPAWSSLTSCAGGQSRSPLAPSEPPTVNHKKGGQHEEVKKEEVAQQNERIFSSTHCSSGFDRPWVQPRDHQAEKKRTDGVQNLSHTPPARPSAQGWKCHGGSAASTQPSGPLDQDRREAGSTETGACALDIPVIRYSKAQRPTSLPIQPFVLVPGGRPQTQAQHLGCLLEQYANHKAGKSASAHQPAFKFRGKRSQCFSNLQLSPMGSRCPVFLEVPSSSDSCSTCTPSPERVGRRHTWSQSSRSQGRPSPCASRSGPDPTHSCGARTNSFVNLSKLVKIPTCQDLISLGVERIHAGANDDPGTQTPNLNHGSYVSVFSDTPPTLPLSPPKTPQSPKKLPQPPAVDSGFFHGSFTAALSSVAPLSSLSSLLSLAASGLQPQQGPAGGGEGRKLAGRRGESLTLSDRPPAEFCLSPDTSYESMSISHLQRRGLLRSVSRAVDLIMAHFGSSRDPEVKMRLGNSSRSPTIGGLVLEHLCPTIQNILEDGLRDHKLDLIIGQRRNHCWGVVEVSTRIGASTRVLHSLVSKIRQCPQLTSHCMRLRAFIMGLLNLRALEFWLSHLQSQKDVVMTHYHSWGFLATSLGRCQSLFQELLLLLQPLAALPFDLNLLLEPRLLRGRQLCPDVSPPPPPCSGLLVTAWPRLQADRKPGEAPATGREQLGAQNPSCCKQESCLDPVPEWWPKEPDLVDGVVEGEDCSRHHADTWSQISMDSRPEERRAEKDSGTPSASPRVRVQSPCQGGLRWAKLFGGGDTPARAEEVSQSHVEAQTRRCRRPSQWLHLDRLQLGRLAQSIRSMRPSGAQTGKD